MGGISCHVSAFSAKEVHPCELTDIHLEAEGSVAGSHLRGWWNRHSSVEANCSMLIYTKQASS